MDGEAGWCTTSGKIGLPPLARVMGMGRQQQAHRVQTVLELCTFFFCFWDELSFLDCDDICMCIVNKHFEVLKFVFNSVYVDPFE